MKTTLNVDDSIMRRLRQEAARRGVTMSELVEAGLRRVLAGERPPRSRPPALPDLPSWKSGGARVDVADRDALATVMDDR